MEKGACSREARRGDGPLGIKRMGEWHFKTRSVLRKETMKPGRGCKLNERRSVVGGKKNTVSRGRKRQKLQDPGKAILDDGEKRGK